MAGEAAAHMAFEHPDYSRLAGRIAVTSLYKGTSRRFSSYVAGVSAGDDIVLYVGP